MMSASKMSEAIRMKRKKLREEGEITDTSPQPGMNPQNVWDEEKRAQIEETIPGAGDGSRAPGEATMETAQKDDSQDPEVLKKRMARVRMLFDSL